MQFFLIMSPYLAFSSLNYVASLTASVLAAALVSIGLNVADHVRGRSPKAIGLTSTAMFASMAATFIIAGQAWSGLEVRLVLDLGIFMVALVSIALRRPFTLQYAREAIDAATQGEPGFLHVNYVLSWVWAGAMALMMATSVLAIYLPWLPLWAGLALTFVLRNGAVAFSKWYPKHQFGQAATT